MPRMRALLLLLLAAVSAFAEPVYQFTAPAGWTMTSRSDPRTGAPTTRLSNGAIVLDATFYPDKENRFATKEQMEALMRVSFGHLLEGAVQKEMTFTFTETENGLVGHTAFTDAKWVGREIPKNEWRHATAGVRRWPGTFVHFTILSNDLDSAEYKQALDTVKSGIVEK